MDDDSAHDHAPEDVTVVDETGLFEALKLRLSRASVLGAIIAVIALSQVLATELTRLVQDDGFNAPFFVMWVHAAEMSLLFPLSGVFFNPIKARARSADVVTFLIMYFGANYSYVRALQLAPASYVQAIFGTAPAAVALLSSCSSLREHLSMRRLGAVVCAGAGAFCLSWRNGGSRHDSGGLALGIVLAETAVINAALYKVGFKIKFGSPSPAYVTRFVGTLGLFAACLGAPVVLGLFLSGVEDSRISMRRVVILLAGGIVDVVYNVSIALGLALSPSPLYVSVATMLAIPAAAAVDTILNHLQPSLGQLIGTSAIILSFALLTTEHEMTTKSEPQFSRVGITTDSPLPPSQSPRDEDSPCGTTLLRSPKE